MYKLLLAFTILSASARAQDLDAIMVAIYGDINGFTDTPTTVALVKRDMENTVLPEVKGVIDDTVVPEVKRETEDPVIPEGKREIDNMILPVDGEGQPESQRQRRHASPQDSPDIISCTVRGVPGHCSTNKLCGSTQYPLAFKLGPDTETACSSIGEICCPKF